MVLLVKRLSSSGTSCMLYLSTFEHWDWGIMQPYCVKLYQRHYITNSCFAIGGKTSENFLFQYISMDIKPGTWRLSIRYHGGIIVRILHHVHDGMATLTKCRLVIGLIAVQVLSGRKLIGWPCRSNQKKPMKNLAALPDNQRTESGKCCMMPVSHDVYCATYHYAK